jgi:tRNA(Ile)-lysidine synthetase-like protein
MLQAEPGLKLTVAHFDHGIRPDSREDRVHVAALAQHYGLPFVYSEGQLGPDTSEAVARRARYDFLRQVQRAANARAIITAHHQDDMLETAVINLHRGTGRKGLSSLKSIDGIKRPLLHLPKADLKQYADQHGLKWREDSTNQQTKYLRNRIRHHVLARATPEQRQRLLELIERQHELNQAIDQELINLLHQQPSRQQLDRHSFIMLPHDLSRELLAAWLRHNGITNFDRRAIERLVRAGKTYPAGKLANIHGSVYLKMSGKHLALLRPER